LEVELVFLDFLCQLNAANRHSRRLESLESEHRPNSLFDSAMVLFDDVIKYLQERICTRRGKVPAAFNLVTARCEAAYPSKVITRVLPLFLIAWEKNRLAAAMSRRLLKRKSTVLPCLSTAR
jgi:hypothetical protein